MNCLDWYTAFAFCAWDGGRLPTEAEWNYAAAGGSEQRYYPWSNPATDETIDEDHALLKAPLLVVGSKSPLGDGRFGQADLAGSFSEWVLDFSYSIIDYPVPCTDCANFKPPRDGNRGYRGGSIGEPALYNYTGQASGALPEARAATLGVRCARSP
jgi:formylglycine-generating enzyme required for sulfatase activity